jgi:uncharacterized membrane protein
MSLKHTHEERLKFQLDRIALFSDAVFAIAITLLVIEIKVPIIPYDAGKFNENLSHALAHMFPEFIGFLISFIVIGQTWKSHHTMFGFVTDYDRRLLSLNTWLLFTVVCMPFTTGLMSRYLYFVPYLVYSINIVVMGLLQSALWRHINNHKHRLNGGVPDGMRRFMFYNTSIVISFFLLSLLIHRLFGGGIARIFLALIFIVQTVCNNYFRKKYKLGRKY